MIMGMKAYVLIKVQTGKAHQVLAALKPLSTARQAHVCFSRPDIICFVEATGDRALSILFLPGMLETETQIVIED